MSDTAEPSTQRVLVIQSHRHPLPWPWLADCLASVRDWAAGRSFDYRFLDDALFARLPPDIARKISSAPVVASDLARLIVLSEALAEGYDAAVWMDADTLVTDPRRLRLPGEAYALGREIWVQPSGSGYRPYVKVHNAFLMFRAGNPFLPFYTHAAERILRRHEGPMVPQLVGPKLLTALHNIMHCPIVEEAAMLSPAVSRDLLAGGGAALSLFRARCTAAPAAVNLCGSLVAAGELTPEQVADVVERLRRRPGLLRAA